MIEQVEQVEQEHIAIELAAAVAAVEAVEAVLEHTVMGQVAAAVEVALEYRAMEPAVERVPVEVAEQGHKATLFLAVVVALVVAMTGQAHRVIVCLALVVEQVVALAQVVPGTEHLVVNRWHSLIAMDALACYGQEATTLKQNHQKTF